MQKVDRKFDVIYLEAMRRTVERQIRYVQQEFLVIDKRALERPKMKI